jgi:hypothetical protein
MKKPGPTRITIKTILSNGKTETRHLRTPPNQFLSQGGIDWLLHEEAKRVEEFFPGLEFRLVPLRSGVHFNFVQIAGSKTISAGSDPFVFLGP